MRPYLLVHRGEGWREMQSCQIFHYKSDGRFVSQFGLPLGQGVVLNPTGSAGNIINLQGVKIGSTIFLYHNDENGRGLHRWKINL